MSTRDFEKSNYWSNYSNIGQFCCWHKYVECYLTFCKVQFHCYLYDRYYDPLKPLQYKGHVTCYGHESCDLLWPWVMWPPMAMSHVTSYRHESCDLPSPWVMWPPIAMSHVTSYGHESCDLLSPWTMWHPIAISHGTSYRVLCWFCDAAICFIWIPNSSMSHIYAYIRTDLYVYIYLSLPYCLRVHPLTYDLSRYTFNPCHCRVCAFLSTRWNMLNCV